MEKYIINGGRKLCGKIVIAPAKNACLPLIASSILFNNSFVLKNAPKIADVEVMAEIIKGLVLLCLLSGAVYSLAYDKVFTASEAADFVCEKYSWDRVVAQAVNLYSV